MINLAVLDTGNQDTIITIPIPKFLWFKKLFYEIALWTVFLTILLQINNRQKLLGGHCSNPTRSFGMLERHSSTIKKQQSLRSELHQYHKSLNRFLFWLGLYEKIIVINEDIFNLTVLHSNFFHFVTLFHFGGI